VTRQVAFLRAINVGGHNVRMDALKRLFEEVGLADVSTFIASGNVILVSDEGRDVLEQRLSSHLETALGYGVEVFLRTDAEIARIAETEPFDGMALSDGASRHVAFLHEPPTADARVAVLAYSNDTDRLSFDGRELHWLRQGSFSDSALSGPKLEKALGAPTTVRNLNTVRKLAAKLPTR
jgi:uncharacterized protein (DUF1697 family)